MTPTQFEDRLLAELRAIVAEQPAPAPAPARRAGRRAPRLLAGGAAAAGLAAAAILVASGGDPAAPAFAVERQSDGTVTVTITRLSDADGLERELRAAGITAAVDYTPAGKTCRQPRGKDSSASATGRHSMGVALNGSAVSFTLDRAAVPPGHTLVISTSGGEGVAAIGTSVVEGAVAPCELVDAPLPPAGSSGGAGQGTWSGTAGGSGPSLNSGP